MLDAETGVALTVPIVPTEVGLPLIPVMLVALDEGVGFPETVAFGSLEV